MKKKLTKEELLGFAKSNGMLLSGALGEFVCKVYGNEQRICNRVKYYPVSRKHYFQDQLERFRAAGVFASFVYSIPFIKELWKENYPVTVCPHTIATKENYKNIIDGVPGERCSIVPYGHTMKPLSIVLGSEGVKLDLGREIYGDIAVVLSLYNKGKKGFELLSFTARARGRCFDIEFNEEEMGVIKRYNRMKIFCGGTDEKGEIFSWGASCRIKSKQKDVVRIIRISDDDKAAEYFHGDSERGAEFIRGSPRAA